MPWTALFKGFLKMSIIVSDITEKLLDWLYEPHHSFGYSIDPLFV